MQGKNFEKLINTVKKLSSKNIDSKIKAMLIVRILTLVIGLLLLISISFGGVAIFYDRIIGLSIGLAFGGFFGVIAFVIWFFNSRAFDRRRNVLRCLSTIINKINITPLVSFSDEVFKTTPIDIRYWRDNQGARHIASQTPINLNETQSQELCIALAKVGQLIDIEIIDGKGTAKRAFNLSIGEVKKQAEKPKSNKKIVLDMSNIDTNTNCTNCGAGFEEGDTFCGNCGTKRKDVRRRI